MESRFNFFLEFEDESNSIKYQELYRKSFPILQFLAFHSIVTFFQIYFALKNDFDPPFQILPLRIDNLFFFCVITLNGFFLIFFHWINKSQEISPDWNSIVSKFEIMYLFFGSMMPGLALLIRSIYDDQYCVPNIEKCNILHDFHYLHPTMSTFALFAPFGFITYLKSPYKRFNFISWIICIAILITSIVVSGNYNSFLLIIMAFVMLLTSYQSEKQNILAFLAFMQASETEIKLDLSVKAMEMKRAYYRYISHEIRTPLSVANLGLNLIESEAQIESSLSNSNEIHANIKYCRDAVQSAVSILNDLIENEKLESKLLNLESEPHSFSPILSSVMGPFMLMSREKRISLSVDFAVDRYFNLPGLSAVLPASSLSAPVSLLGSVSSSSDPDLSKCYSELPPSAFPSPESSLPLESVLPSGLIFADQHKIAQVVRNLVSNALKFTPKGGEVAILVSYLTEQNEWAKSVLDEKQAKLAAEKAIKVVSQKVTPQKMGSLNRIGRMASFSLTRPSPSISEEESLNPSLYFSSTPATPLGGFLSSRIYPSFECDSADHNKQNTRASPINSTTPRSSNDGNKSSRHSSIGPSNEVSPSISMKNEPPTPMTGVLLVEVVDSGAGIKAEDQTLLFAEAVQIDAGKLQGGGGSGLGLYNSRRIVEMHGGGMGMRSEGTGKGCTFFFWLPLYHPDSSPPDRVEVSAYVDRLMDDSHRSSESFDRIVDSFRKQPHDHSPSLSVQSISSGPGGGGGGIGGGSGSQFDSALSCSSTEKNDKFSSAPENHSVSIPRTTFDSLKKMIGLGDKKQKSIRKRPSYPKIYRYHFKLNSLVQNALLPSTSSLQVSTLRSNSILSSAISLPLFTNSSSSSSSHSFTSSSSAPPPISPRSLTRNLHFSNSSTTLLTYNDSLRSQSQSQSDQDLESQLHLHVSTLPIIPSTTESVSSQQSTQLFQMAINDPSSFPSLINLTHQSYENHSTSMIGPPSIDLSLSACLSLSSDPSPAFSRLVLSSVLLVEDSDLVRKLTRKTLEAGKSGNCCFEARNGREAVEMVRERMRAARHTFNQSSSSMDSIPSHPPPSPSSQSLPSPNNRLSNSNKTKYLPSHSLLEQFESEDECFEPYDFSIRDNSSSRSLPPSQVSVSPPHLFSGEFGLVLMDSVMPEMSGPEATQALREMGYRGLIVGLTGNAMEEDTAHFKALGASAVLAKPLDYQQLVQVVRKYLDEEEE